MESWLSPVGPLPAAVYWRRRALVVLAVVIIGWMFAQLTHSDASAKQGQQARHSQSTPTARTTARSTARSTARPVVKPTATHAKAPAAHPAVTGAAKGGVTSGTTAVHTLRPCATGAISLALATDASSYPAGSEPRITLTVTNTSASTCTADLGPKARVLTITSGSDRIWSSADCGGKTSTVTALAPKQAIAYAVSWSRHRSRPGCSGTTRIALPGTYKVSAQLGSVTAPSAVFSLR